MSPTLADLALIVNQMVFDYTPYPNAAKEYLRFMMEQEQYAPYLEACIGYWNHPLQTYDNSPVWTDDPKHECYKHVLKNAIWDSYSGSISEASSAVLSEFVIVQMVASVCAGQATPEEAAAEAQRRTERYYNGAGLRVGPARHDTPRDLKGGASWRQLPGGPATRPRATG